MLLGWIYGLDFNIIGWDNCMEIIQPLPPERERERD
jgi:hypothetical protein